MSPPDAGTAGAGTATAVVIGVGNEYRHDDGIGPAVAAEIGKRDLPGTRVVVSDGDLASLLEAWDGVDLAVVVDAVKLEDPTPGRVHRSSEDWWPRGVAGHGVRGIAPREAGCPPAATPDVGGGGASSHGFGVPEAVLLGRALDRMPGKLVVFAVEAADLELGPGLSEPVAAALGGVVEAVLAELGR